MPETYTHPAFERVRDVDTRILAESKAIRRFKLRLTPKDACEWIRARIRASGDCTVPGSAQFGFELHTVPHYFSSNGANYEIWADHYDTRSKGKGVRLRRIRHVGNVYLSEIMKNGEKILYVSGIQLASPYRSEYNGWIGGAVVRGLTDLARGAGYRSLWVQADILSHHPPVARDAVSTALHLGGKIIQPKIDEIDYVDLPPDHYAAPHGSQIVAVDLRR